MTTKKLLLIGAVAVVGVIAYRRFVRSPDAPQGAAAGAPVELEGGGTPYGTVATTDIQKARSLRTFVPAQEVFPTSGENALMGVYT